MNRLTGFETAVEYIENNLTNRLDYEDIAACAYCSNYHFQRIFAAYAGCTLGEYIRNRRMTLAAAELKGSSIRVLDLAIKYGYENPEGFSRAFTKFHGVTPSKARKSGAKLKSFSRLNIYESYEGGNIVDYTIVSKPSATLLGYKKKFVGAPYGEERKKQEREFFEGTRINQWILKGVSAVSTSGFSPELDFCLLNNFSDDGYDFYYTQPISDGMCKELENIDIGRFNIEKITIPSATYAVFKTNRQRYPNDSYMKLCKYIICEWIASTNYQLSDSPELVIYHWHNDDKEQRFIEIYVPIEIKR